MSGRGREAAAPPRTPTTTTSNNYLFGKVALMRQTHPDETAATAVNRQMAEGCLARHARAYRAGPSVVLAAEVRGRLERVVRARTASVCRTASRPQG
jgi:hypothetical protein